jgi:hypothetical protein
LTNERYTYCVFWSEEDGEFVAACEEFPSLSWMAEDEVTALLGLKALIHDEVNQNFLQLGPVQIDYSYEAESFRRSMIAAPAPQPEPEHRVVDGLEPYMAGESQNFPMCMAYFDGTRKRPWRLFIYDPSSRMYVTVRSYLTELEASVAVYRVEKGWSLDDVLLPN